MKLNELLNIKYPIIQGGMANIATGAFAASVSNAGGLGLIGAGGMNAKMLKAEIQACKKLTNLLVSILCYSIQMPKKWHKSLLMNMSQL